MYQIINKKGTGKTTNLITLAKENNAVIVTNNPQHVIDKMYRLGITGIDVISYEEFELKKQGFNKPYVIDELENFVKAVCGPNMIGYTLTTEE